MAKMIGLIWKHPSRKRDYYGNIISSIIRKSKAILASLPAALDLIAPLVHPTSKMPKSERTRHSNFIKSEFHGNGFLVTDDFGINELLIEEVVETIFEPAFEGRRPTHGAIICTHDYDDFLENSPPHSFIEMNGPDAHSMCDGLRTFKLICKDKVGVVSFTYALLTNEIDLFTLRDDVLFVKGKEEHGRPLRKDLFAIKRGMDGAITILCREGIAVHRDARFTFSKYQYHYKDMIGRYLLDKYEENPWDNQVIDSILRVAVHILGPMSGVGGSFVLFHPDDVSNISRINDNALNLQNAIIFPKGMKVSKRGHQPALINLMRHTDGGTRHLTARSFSTLIEGMVFVVSSDGPVTLYAGGERIFRTAEA